MLRSLKFFWPLSTAMVAGVMITAAVITGALLVGDSVRGSLEQMTLSRLGGVDWALEAQGLVRESLAHDLAKEDGPERYFARASPLLRITAPFVHSGSKRRASRVSLHGVDASFNLFFESDLEFGRKEGQVFPSILINQTLATELGASVGDQVLVSVEKHSEVHRESLLGSRDPFEQIETLRLEVSRILPNQGVGRFELVATQAVTPVAFVEKSLLQRRLGMEGKVNTIVFAESPGVHPSKQSIESWIASHLVLEDFSLKLVRGEEGVYLQSHDFVLAPKYVELGEKIASELRMSAQRVVTYLTNRIDGPQGSTPYSTVCALDSLENTGRGLHFPDGSEAPPVSEGNVYVNEWLSRDLSVSVGEKVSLSYFLLNAGGQLETRSADFHVAGVVALQGLGADRALVPEFPGIQDRVDMASWDPPFPVDLRLVRKKDEDYWDEYRAIPKAFVSMEDAVRLWSTRFGVFTSLRLYDHPSEGGPGLEQGRLEAFRVSLAQQLAGDLAGFRLTPVKQAGLDASSSPTDFSGLFLGFSFFLVISAALVAGSLFRLNIEFRSREIGLLLALGYPPVRVRRSFLAEGLVLGLAGIALGLPLGLGYGSLLLVGLRTWWLPAVGTSELLLRVQSLSLAVSGAVSLLAVVFFGWIAGRSVMKRSALGLLAGKAAREGRSPTPWSRWLPYSMLILAVLVVSVSLWRGTRGEGSAQENSLLFFLTGTLLLIGAVSLFRNWCHRSGARRGVELSGLFSMAVRDSTRNAARSVLSVALVACATFVIVAVGAFRPGAASDLMDKESGTGGFALLGKSDVPLLLNLQIRDNLDTLGFTPEEISLIQSSTIFSFRVLPGDDTSCLNLYRPSRPRILGVPKAFMERGGFGLHRTLSSQETSWNLLQEEVGDGIVPALGDFESVQWILQKRLGDTVQIQDDFGSELNLRLQGLLENTIFQSELLISENSFLKYFPRRTGYSFFLIEVDPKAASDLSAILESRLSDYGFDVSSTADRLRQFQAVRSTYISTFQSLGALGMLLGTVGLGVILIRNVLERRKELAVMLAFGFPRRALHSLVLLENCILLALGLAIGTGCAFVAVAPSLASATVPLPWVSLLVTVGAVLFAGVAASVTALGAIIRLPLLPALKSE